jgi:hypothetical protein
MRAQQTPTAPQEEIQALTPEQIIEKKKNDLKNSNPLHSRFKGAPWYTGKKEIVTIGGAGGIGSWLSLLLSRAGYSILIYDFDMVEQHNLGGQLYSNKYINKKKVAALADIVANFCGSTYLMRAMDLRVGPDTPVTPCCFSAFDNMEARKNMFLKWKASFEGDEGIFIDGRLEAEQMWIYCVRANDPEAIEAYLKVLEVETDQTIAEADCTIKQTSHAAAMIASHMTGFFTNHMTNVIEEASIRFVPYKWSYAIPIDMLENEYLNVV